MDWTVLLSRWPGAAPDPYLFALGARARLTLPRITALKLQGPYFREEIRYLIYFVKRNLLINKIIELQQSITLVKNSFVAQLYTEDMTGTSETISLKPLLLFGGGALSPSSGNSY